MKRRNFLGAIIGAGALAALPPVQPVAAAITFEREEIPTEWDSAELTARRMTLYLQRGWISHEAALRYMGLDPYDPEVQDALRG